MSGLELIGSRELERKFKRMAEGVQRKIARKSVTKASAIIRKDAKAKAPRKTGLLAKSLTSKIKVYKGTGNVVGIIGPRTRMRNPVKGQANPSKYAHLAHDGFVTKSGRHVPGVPFLKQAIEQQGERALGTLKSTMAAGITAEALK